ncbi:TetR/AcrR family transcriptional regulator [Gordonia shandongensis]|uniref:TetR/AcrR family transcriptional regulator n=1 Tax=Gordonia shandongensis TaxID=376351 RepID=UPI00040C9162|nr:TetR family transcriptional regulator [Gordonia shandongensis]
MIADETVPSPEHGAPGTRAPETRPGLRERQKARTRADIRAAAIDLFTSQGYDATTVAQIADAADVSHTTFFRYFQSKEQVIVSDDLDEKRAAAFAAIPAGLDHFALVREILTRMYRIEVDDPWASNLDRLRIVRAEPSLRAMFQLESDRVISEVTGMIAEYLGVDPDSMRLRVFVAAVAGVMFHMVDISEKELPDLEEYLDALDCMERGFPL